MHTTTAGSHLPYFKIFSNSVHVCLNFQIFNPFPEKLHPCRYFLEYNLPKQTSLLFYLDHPNRDFFHWNSLHLRQPLRGIDLHENEALKD